MLVKLFESRQRNRCSWSIL